MRLTLPRVVALSLLTAPALANEHPGTHRQESGKSEQTLEQVLQEAASAGERPSARDDSARPSPPDAKPTEATHPAAHAEEKPAAPAQSSTVAKPAAAAPAVEAAPATDDNDTTAEAAPPAPLHAVIAATAQPRVRGPYQLGALDCRVLDGAGIERVLPTRLIAGEEPDLLCRVLVTQPPEIATASHQLTVSVTLGDRETYRQVRNVRTGTVGRRSLVFLVPADRIATDENKEVRIRAQLSAPAAPPTGRLIKFSVETED